MPMSLQEHLPAGFGLPLRPLRPEHRNSIDGPLLPEDRTSAARSAVAEQVTADLLHGERRVRAARLVAALPPLPPGRPLCADDAGILRLQPAVRSLSRTVASLGTHPALRWAYVS